MDANSRLLIVFLLIGGLLLSLNIHIIQASTEAIPGSSFDTFPSHEFPFKFKVVSKRKPIKPPQPPKPNLPPRQREKVSPPPAPP
ncbi:hypothetical protein CRYUN_Cryun16bG0025100 [Craigia yunnanensis]